jgi:hypothetical protein
LSKDLSREKDCIERKTETTVKTKVLIQHDLKHKNTAGQGFLNNKVLKNAYSLTRLTGKIITPFLPGLVKLQYRRTCGHEIASTDIIVIPLAHRVCSTFDS